jgi:hypothetical protein
VDERRTAFCKPSPAPIATPRTSATTMRMKFGSVITFFPEDFTTPALFNHAPTSQKTCDVGACFFTIELNKHLSSCVCRCTCLCTMRYIAVDFMPFVCRLLLRLYRESFRQQTRAKLNTQAKSWLRVKQILRD